MKVSSRVEWEDVRIGEVPYSRSTRRNFNAAVINHGCALAFRILGAAWHHIASVDANLLNFNLQSVIEVPAMIVAIQAQDFSKSQCVAGLRAALNILDKWKASCEQACRILRISRSTYTRAKQRDSEWTIGLDSDQLQRISIVLNIHAALRLVFDNPENVYGFPSMKNDNEFFNGRAPLDVMAQGDMISLYETFRRIDTLRGAQW